MSNEAIAQARRLHLHALHGGSVTALDLSRLVQAMERMQAKLHAASTSHAEINQLRQALQDIDEAVELDQQSTKTGAASHINALVREIAGAALGEGTP
jgi:hypothetical protein